MLLRGNDNVFALLYFLSNAFSRSVCSFLYTPHPTPTRLTRTALKGIFKNEVKTSKTQSDNKNKTG